ncbi:hypothetical protein HUT18_19535 [Streptomyces sp. NA04227]|uniref:hypothetical protein n=1 Tax=Streptomyces sp. NA04227 TaxID=2742136 RepID=UPI0015926002|nr:hypothetical protein [Streptomyces sp. NA04227]QKW08241.1 hypothetical protein HUT18_19535 [Streptomyces sp. NA04227]
MAIADDLRRTLTDPKPLYFVAGSADLALQRARKVPGLIDQIVAEAPSRIESVRTTDPKAVQEKAASRAKEAQDTLQTKVTELLGALDSDVKKLGETAQGAALRGVGVAFEYAVKAREAYEKVAEHGEQTVRTWRGDAAEDLTEIAVVVEPEPVVVEDEKPAAKSTAKTGPKPAKASGTAKPAATAPAKKTVTRKATPAPRKAATSKTAAGNTTARNSASSATSPKNGSPAKNGAKSPAAGETKGGTKKSSPSGE